MRHHTFCASIFWYCQMVDLLSVVLSSEKYSEQQLWVSDFFWAREVPSSSVWYKECFWEKQQTEVCLSDSEKSGKMYEMTHDLLNFERTQRIIAEDSRAYTCFANTFWSQEDAIISCTPGFSGQERHHWSEASILNYFVSGWICSNAGPSSILC